MNDSTSNDGQSPICFSVDWEDWYHGLRLPTEVNRGLERRLRIGHDILLNLLAERGVKATFFILGECLEEFPELVQEIKDAGHELACHTYSHPFLAEISDVQLREEIRKCKELIKPFQDGFAGFRAPYFSINRQSLWALEILKDEGFRYDSSIFPGNTFRSGIVGFPRGPHRSENGLIEFPISNFRFLGLDFGLGGAYFRAVPYPYFRRRTKQILRQTPGICYFHPWEFDLHQPHVRHAPGRARHSHYFNLRATRDKMRAFLNDFEFVPLSQILKKRGLNING